MDADDAVLTSIVHAADAIAAGLVSPRELVDLCFARIDALDSSIGAFVAVDRERSRATADRLTKEIGTSGVRGPLHGIPVAVKDVIDVHGMPTRAGSTFTSADVAHHDAASVQRLRKAGAVIIGKTRTHEFAYGAVTPGCTNPLDASRIAGGSSGGSAACVAARMALGAVGTDTAGSIRIPSALCGVAGLKPTPTAGMMHGVLGLAPSLDVVGPIAPTVGDLQIMRVAGDPRTADGGVRIGIPTDVHATFGELHPDLLSAWEVALAALGDAGADVVEVALPGFSEWSDARQDLLMSEALDVHRTAGWYPAFRSHYSAEVRHNLDYASTISKAQLRASALQLSSLSAQFRHAFSQVTAILTPTTPTIAPKFSELGDLDPTTRRSPIAASLSLFTGPVNVLSMAAVTVPVWTGTGGLPAGLQVIAEGDLDALGGAAVLERSLSS